MQLAYSFLAEAAEVIPSRGQFFVYNGGVETIPCPGLPAFVPILAYVGKIRILPEERDVVHHTQLRCLRPTGELLFPAMDSRFDPTGIVSPPDRPSYHLFIVNFRGVQIQEHGEHRFVPSCDGNDLGSVSFFAEPLPSGQTQRIAPEAGNE